MRTQISNMCPHATHPDPLGALGNNLQAALRRVQGVSCKWANSTLFSPQFRCWGMERVLWVMTEDSGQRGWPPSVPVRPLSPRWAFGKQLATQGLPGPVLGPMPAGCAPCPCAQPWWAPRAGCRHRVSLPGVPCHQGWHPPCRWARGCHSRVGPGRACLCPHISGSFPAAAARWLQSPAARVPAALHQLARLWGAFHPHRDAQVPEESEDDQPRAHRAHRGPLQVRRGLGPATHKGSAPGAPTAWAEGKAGGARTSLQSWAQPREPAPHAFRGSNALSSKAREGVPKIGNTHDPRGLG